MYSYYKTSKKASGEGTGLELWLSYDLVTKGRGVELKVERNEAKGQRLV